MAKLEEKQHDLNVSTQGHAEAREALERNRIIIKAAGEEIDDLRKTGKVLCEKNVLLRRKAASEIMFDIYKAIAVLALLLFNFIYYPQGLFWTIIWGLMLLWAFVASIFRKHSKTIENLWLLFFLVLSAYLSFVSVSGSSTRLGRVLFEIISGTGNDVVIGHIAIGILMLICQLGSIFWHRLSLEEGSDSTKREKAQENRIRADHKVFYGKDNYKYAEELNEPLKKKYDKAVFSDSEREERSRGREYLLILPGSEALPEDYKGAKIVCDTREDDTENPMVVYEADNLSMWSLMRDWKKKKTRVLDKASKSIREPDDHPDHSR